MSPKDLTGFVVMRATTEAVMRSLVGCSRKSNASLAPGVNVTSRQVLPFASVTGVAPSLFTTPASTVSYHLAVLARLPSVLSRVMSASMAATARGGTERTSRNCPVTADSASSWVACGYWARKELTKSSNTSLSDLAACSRSSRSTDQRPAVSISSIDSPVGNRTLWKP